MKEAQFFTVVADEVADVSNTEQMSIIVRYVDGLCEIREELALEQWLVVSVV